VAPPLVVNSTVTLTVNGIFDADGGGINEVWAVVYPPDFQPPSTKNAIIELPRIQLLESPSGSGNYTGSASFFTTPGTYQIIINAADGDSNLSDPEYLTVNINNPFTRRAVIIAGHSDDPGRQAAIHSSASFAFAALDHQGYTASDIQFHSVVAGPNVNDNTPTLAEIRESIENWAAINTQDVVVVLVGESDGSRFRLSSSEMLKASDAGTADNDLDGWLDTLQADLPATGKLTVLMDADNAGFYLARLSTPQDSEEARIRIAGTIGGPASLGNDGNVSFSRFFWGNIANGVRLPVAYIRAQRVISAATLRAQKAWIDSNSDNTSDKGDTSRLNDYHLGPGTLVAGSNPVIGSVTVTGDENAANPALTLRAGDVFSIGEIDYVWAEIAGPFREGSETPALQRLALPLTDGGVYESVLDAGSYAGEFKAGRYQITFYAIDTDGAISPPKEAVVTRTVGPDAYEEDDTVTEANRIAVDGAAHQLHTFDYGGDVDWVAFHGVAGMSYTINADPSDYDADLKIILKDSQGNTVKEEDSVGSGTPEKEQLLSDPLPQDGLYFAGVLLDPDVTAVLTDYELWVTREGGGTGTTGITGQVKDTNGDGVALAFIKAEGIGSTTGTSTTYSLTPGGGYSIDDGAGTYTVTTTRTDYQTAIHTPVPIPDDGFHILNIDLIPAAVDSDGDGYINALDNCPQQANGDQDNFDGDAEGDICDPDDDNDGLPDTDEATICNGPVCLDPLDPDTDDDGFNDGMEVIYGSNPLLDTDTPANNYVNNGDVNGIGGVDAADVLLATRIMLNQYTPTDAEKVRVDMVPDGVINAGDVVRIQQAALGM